METKIIAPADHQLGDFLRTLAAKLEAATPMIVEIKSISIKAIHKETAAGTFNYRAVVKLRHEGKIPAGKKVQQKAGGKAMMLMSPLQDAEWSYEHLDDCTWWPVRQR